MQAYRGTFRDFADALSAHRLWFYMASNDIRLRYRGSTLGPIWITLTMAFFIGTLSIVYSRLFHQDIKEYVPFLTVSILTWAYISSVITDSTETFLSSKEFIEGMRMPYFLFIFRMIWRNFLILMHNFLVYILVILFFHVKVTAYILLAIPGFILVTANLAAISVIVSLLGTRFRDLPPIITSIMTVIFFISPITWQAKMIGDQSMIIRLNPVTYFLDLMRAPLLGQLPHLHSAYVAGTLMLVFWLLALMIFSHNSKKIPFWL